MEPSYNIFCIAEVVKLGNICFVFLNYGGSKQFQHFEDTFFILEQTTLQHCIT